jgi:hypothetical protein
MAITTAQIKSLLQPGVNAIFGDYADLPAQWPDVFEKYTSDMAFERDVEYKLLGLGQLRSEGAATAFEDMGERFTYVYKHVAIALGFVMTKFAIRDNLYKTQFRPNARALKHSLSQTKETLGAAVLNNAMDTSGQYFVGDGQPLLSVAHPIDIGTIANTPAVPTQLNETALQDAIVGISRFRDQAGLKTLAKGKRLIIAPENQFVAQRIYGDPVRVGTADRDPNALRELNHLNGGFRINYFLTNTASWYLLTDAPEGFKYFQRDPLEVDMHVDFQTDSLMTKASERFSFGCSNIRAVFGSMP